MKRLLALFVVAVLATTFALAHNEDATAFAQFDVKVIAPLAWDQPADIALGDIIEGQTRTYSPAKILKFNLTGEPNYDITCNAVDIVDPLCPVILTRTISCPASQKLDALGKFWVEFSVTAAAAGAGAHGAYSFEMHVEASYVGL